MEIRHFPTLFPTSSLPLCQPSIWLTDQPQLYLAVVYSFFIEKKVGAEVEEVDVLEPNAAGSDTILESIRVAREINNLNNNQENEINQQTPAAAAEKTDQDAQSTDKSDQKADAAESPAFDELTLDSLEDDKSHDKRFVSIVDLAVNFFEA